MKIRSSILNINIYTWVGMILSMFGISAINLFFNLLFGDQLNDGQMVTKELLIFAAVGVLLFFIIPKENLNIDFEFSNWLFSFPNSQIFKFSNFSS